LQVRALRHFVPQRASVINGAFAAERGVTRAPTTCRWSAVTATTFSQARAAVSAGGPLLLGFGLGWLLISLISGRVREPPDALAGVLVGVAAGHAARGWLAAGYQRLSQQIPGSALLRAAALTIGCTGLISAVTDVAFTGHVDRGNLAFVALMTAFTSWLLLRRQEKWRGTLGSVAARASTADVHPPEHGAG
jgi:hypothetical protein